MAQTHSRSTLLCIAAVLYLASNIVEGSSAKKPNIVLFMPDDLPFYWPEAPKLPTGYNGAQIPSADLPWFKKLREEGTVFTNAYTAGPMCAPSRFNLMTGRFCSRSTYAQGRSAGKTVVDVTVPNCKVNDDVTETVAHIFKSNGWETIFSGKWHISKYPGARAAAAWDDYEGVEKLVEDAGYSTVASVYNENIENPTTLGFSHNNEWMVNTSSAALEKAHEDGKPFFLYFAPTSPHTPTTEQALFDFSVRDTPNGTLEHDPATPDMPSRASVWSRASGNDVAAGSIWVDDALGALYKKIDALGEIDNTLFCS